MGDGTGEKGSRPPPLEQKAHNQEISKARAVVEHTISRVKKFNIFGTEFRNRFRFYDSIAGLA